MKEIHHFYHLYTGGQWKEAVDDHLNALINYGLYEKLKSFQIGIVGEKENIENVKKYLLEKNIKYTICNEERSGYEQVTLNKLYEFSLQNDGYVFYAHTKGSTNLAADLHRKCMLYYNIYYWKEIQNLLDNKFDAIGCYYIKQSCSCGVHHINNEHLVHNVYNGNFWWIKLDVIKKGDYPGQEHRWRAEHYPLDHIYILPDFKFYDLRHMSCPELDWEYFRNHNNSHEHIDLNNI